MDFGTLNMEITLCMLKEEGRLAQLNESEPFQVILKLYHKKNKKEEG